MASKFKKLHLPFLNNTAKTAPAEGQAFIPAAQQVNLQKKDSLNQRRRQTIIHRTDSGRRRNTLWSDTVEMDLVANLSALELNRQEVLFEIIKTEAEYVRDLQLIEQHFIRPIKAEEAKCGRSIVPENLNKVFNSVSYFLFIHEVISNCLNERQEHQSPLVRSISDILLAYVWVFRAYAPYLIHYEEALRELDDCLRKKDKLRRVVKKQQKIASCRNMPLTTYLLKPFQRLLQYPLLIQNLLKCTVRDNFDYEDTVTLKTKLDDVLQDVEEQKRAHENKERLRALEARIRGLNGFRLAVDNRQLISEQLACIPPVLERRPPRKTLIALSPSTISKRHSVRNIYTLECNDIVLLAEKTGVTRDGQAIYKLISSPRSQPSSKLDDKPAAEHKAEDSGVFCDD